MRGGGAERLRLVVTRRSAGVPGTFHLPCAPHLRALCVSVAVYTLTRIFQTLVRRRPLSVPCAVTADTDRVWYGIDRETV